MTAQHSREITVIHDQNVVLSVADVVSPAWTQVIFTGVFLSLSTVKKLREVTLFQLPPVYQVQQTV